MSVISTGMENMNQSQLCNHETHPQDASADQDNYKKLEALEEALLQVKLSYLAVKMLHRVVAALRSSP